MRNLACCCLVITLSGCSSGYSREAVPHALLDQVKLLNFDNNVRAWGDKPPKNMKQLVKTKLTQMREKRPELFRTKNQKFDYLALSGGGADGAFGAGLLVGWTRRGTRPEFDIVTGVSTGALTAPFVFLGKKYDATLEEMYTQNGTKQFGGDLQLLAGILGDAGGLVKNNGFKKLIKKYLTPSVLEAIGREHLKGRRLLIGTTNLDEQRPVIWDLGAIAVYGGDQGLQLARDVILASASLPGVFPPVMITARAGEQKFHEMHVDGGPTTAVFFLPRQFQVSGYDKNFNGAPLRTLYIIRNGKLEPEWQQVEHRTINIALRAITTLTKNQSKGDLNRLYKETLESGMNYNLAAIPEAFRLKNREPLEIKYMTKLFNYGLELGKNGYNWKKCPPLYLRGDKCQSVGIAKRKPDVVMPKIIAPIRRPSNVEMSELSF